MRPFHPRHQEILDNEPWLFPKATGQASGAWVRMSIEYARDNGYSLILEGDFKDPAMTLATAEEFAGLGRRVEVIGLAVRAECSRLDRLQRVVTELAVRGQVDATSIPVLQQVAVDAETVAAKVPYSRSPARLAHTAARHGRAFPPRW